MSAPVVVLLHAFPLDHRMWQSQVDDLSRQGWLVHAWDLPGFGGSPVPDAAPGLDAVAAIVADRIERLGHGPVVLGGLSLGGYVVMALARRAPDLVAGLMLCDTKAVADGEHARDARLAMAEAVSEHPGSCAEVLRTSVLPKLVGPTTHEQRPEVLARIAAWLDSANPNAIAWYQRAMAARPDAHADLARLRVPSLVLWGIEDVLSPAEDQQRLVTALQSPTRAVIPACGHLSAVEQPHAVSEAMMAFLADQWSATRGSRPIE